MLMCAASASNGSPWMIEGGERFIQHLHKMSYDALRSRGILARARRCDKFECGATPTLNTRLPNKTRHSNPYQSIPLECGPPVLLICNTSPRPHLQIRQRSPHVAA